ncbi:cytidyltransferase [Arthrobacter sp. Soil782]|uniref:D-glycero-beta-D-manno-heptose 1-phosphate adenylyltransferase n=1 Tax=Arthrobacter sp. Soil782 TaxID=1736410 RepID=UPI0006F85DC7|nr:D-glycero-beta-D-manno-heptose 1-phosphate adenylyltransferase [Arthrobacter sp. Soil782]KRF03980.1 cytidyltransferase [Arthrobacter sp. Soil782]
MTTLSETRGLTEWVPLELARAAPVVTVVGDVILDGWWRGNIERFCREAPAPVVDVQRRDYAPGGAANTAMNLAALGASVRLVGLVGTDDAGTRLRALLDSAGVNTSGLIAAPGVRTTTKNRVIGGDQVMLRLDDQDGEPPADSVAALAAAVPAALQGSAAVVVCDYGTGALGGAVRQALRDHVGGALTVVDAHDPRPWSDLSPAIVTPNAQEAARLLGTAFPSTAAGERVDLVTEHREELFAATGAGAVVVTLDRDGTVLLAEEGQAHRTWARPASEKQASGAGDTFVACLTAGRAAGMPMSAALDLAQAAADVVVGRAGTSVCSTADLAQYLGGLSSTTLPLDELLQRVESEREQSRRIVLTNGCFDVLHRGHTRYLTQAKQLGDVLVVALNGDDSVRRLKGPDRPINSLADRAGVIAALSCVDYVTAFDTDTPVPLIEALRPDIYAKGGDYSSQMLEEAPVVERCGGVVRILDYVSEHSTTAMVKKIRTAPTAAQ